MLKIGVLVSGGGTNLQALIDKMESGYIKDCVIETVVSSRKDAYALKRAEKYGIKTNCISKKEFSSEDDYDDALIKHFKTYEVDLVVLAGFLSILGNRFIEEYENRIINVHPALIPSFCGKGYYGLIPHKKALEYGVKITGATVHFVNNEPDAGPIILQKAVNVMDDDTAEVLQERVMKRLNGRSCPKPLNFLQKADLK